MTTLEQQASRVAIRLLGPDDLGAFEALAWESRLPGLADPVEIAGAPGCVMLLASEGEDLLGCAGLRPDADHVYRDLERGTVPFPVPNVYLFGAYVRAAARGRGVGRELYRRRLALAALVGNGMTLVELLGDGTPNSVHPGTRPGLHFHLTAGFARIGYSPDPDGGVVLGRTEHH